MVRSSVDELRTALSVLKSEKPPAPLNIVHEISNLDFDLVHVHMPDLLLDLVLRITADAICACYDLQGSKQVEYWRSLDLISRKLNLIAKDQEPTSELATYLCKLDDQLAEYGR